MPADGSVADTPALERGGPDRHRVLRRAVVGGAILLAIGLFVLAGMTADTSTDDEVGVSGDIVERLIPARNDETLRQSPVGIDLAPGWALASFTLNGSEIREDEWDVTAELGLYQFVPGSGKTVEVLKADQNCVTMQVFQIADITNTRPIDWCFTVA